MRRAHLPLTALLVLAGLATAPAAASAATAFARVHGGGEAGPRGPVRFTASPGEANRLTVSEAGGRIVFSDAGARVVARGDCEQRGAHAARCPFSEDAVNAFLGDRDDRARIAGSPFLVVHGGTGDDVLQGGRGGDRLEGDSGADTLGGGRGADTLTGGTGRDRVSGGAGDDDLIDGETDATSAPDVYRGGDSRDTSGPDRGDMIDYGLRRRPLRIDLGRHTSNTGDRILGLESVTGGRGADRLTGDGDDNWLEGEGGDDLLRGGGGQDIPLGGAGDDDVRGGDGGDVVWGNSGANRLSGGAGDDLLEAGGRAGDRVGCGAGGDVVVGNRPDTLARDCEQSSASFLTVGVRPALTPAAATFQVRCSGGRPATRCRGTIALAAPDGTLYGQGPYTVLADDNAPPTPVTIPLTAAGSAALQSRRLVAVTYGRAGGYRTELGPIGP
jgi:Ca2+-binding RTX toxin-like protein